MESSLPREGTPLRTWLLLLKVSRIFAVCLFPVSAFARFPSLPNFVSLCLLRLLPPSDSLFPAHLSLLFPRCLSLRLAPAQISSTINYLSSPCSASHLKPVDSSYIARPVALTCVSGDYDFSLLPKTEDTPS